MSSTLARLRESTCPPPFPDGWYRVAASEEIRPGDVKHIECLGEQIALFRRQTCGQIAAIDAFCPHQGANLAYGKVRGDRLQCPFHGWQLDGNGRVSDRPPRRRRVGRTPPLGSDRLLWHGHDLPVCATGCEAAIPVTVPAEDR